MRRRCNIGSADWATETSARRVFATLASAMLGDGACYFLVKAQLGQTQTFLRSTSAC